MINFPLFTKTHSFLKTETRKSALVKFFLLVLILSAYFLYVQHRFGGRQGILVTILTWTFFVFCTPIADAGFVLAFPIRLLIGVKMVYTQIFAYFLAFFINIFTLLLMPATYNKTLLLKLFRQILTTPWPYWVIIFLSFVGTFASIYFGDELMDVNYHKERKKYHRHSGKYKLLVFIFIIIFTITLYNFLLRQMHLNILSFNKKLLPWM